MYVNVGVNVCVIVYLCVGVDLDVNDLWRSSAKVVSTKGIHDQR